MLFPILCFTQSDEIINGSWDVIELEYSAAVLGFPFSGNAYDAGNWNFNSTNYLYSQNLDFQSEPFTIPVPLNPVEIPSLPIQSSSSGTWNIINNETLKITDDLTNVESEYNIILLTDNVMILSGTLPYAGNFEGLENFELEFEIGMTLVKQANIELVSNTNKKNIIKKIDLLGRFTNQKSGYVVIYDDGSVEKKFNLK